MAKKRGPDLVDPRLIKAFEHPLRLEILSILMIEPSSPARIERRLEHTSLNLVSHHMKVLKETGCIELLETVNKSGAKESIYQAARSFVVSDEAWEEVAPKARNPFTAAILRLISDDLADSLASGKLEERPDRHLSRVPLKLDEEGWEEVRNVLARALEEVMAVGTRSAERIEKTGGPSFPASVAIMLFPQSESDA
ncbi:MAG TPA: helix-turn-helix domain-containing protein [Solirubrobacterales bacterium]|nr:helix-turn-helix domain-containing protein [Solirubrobacterales bacterium]